MEVIQAEDHDLEGHWYHSARDLDLYIWKDESHTIIKQQLSFSGLIAEWNIVEGVKTGTLSDDEAPSKVSGSSTIEYHKKPERFVLDQARQICENIEDLSTADKKQCNFNWGSQQLLSVESFSDFLKNYAKSLISSKKP